MSRISETQIQADGDKVALDVNSRRNEDFWQSKLRHNAGRRIGRLVGSRLLASCPCAVTDVDERHLVMATMRNLQHKMQCLESWNGRASSRPLWLPNCVGFRSPSVRFEKTA